MSKPPKKQDAPYLWRKLEHLAARADVAEVKAAFLGYVAKTEQSAAERLVNADTMIDATETLLDQVSVKTTPMSAWMGAVVGNQFEQVFQMRKNALQKAYAVQDRLLRPLSAEPVPFDLASPLVANDRAMQNIRRHLDGEHPHTPRQAKLEECLTALAGIEQQPLDGVHLGEILVRKLKPAPAGRVMVLQ